jgi:hypothetical protein
MWRLRMRLQRRARPHPNEPADWVPGVGLALSRDLRVPMLRATHPFRNPARQLTVWLNGLIGGGHFEDPRLFRTLVP